MLIQDIKPPMIKTKVPVRISGSVKVIGETYRQQCAVIATPQQIAAGITPPLNCQWHKHDLIIELAFHINGKQYRGTPYNCEVMDAYMHTGNSKYLSQLEGGK